MFLKKFEKNSCTHACMQATCKICVQGQLGHVDSFTREKK